MCLQVLHSGDLICEGTIKMQAEPAKAEEPKKDEVTAEPVPVPTTGASATEPLVTVSARPCSTVLSSKGAPRDPTTPTAQ